MSDDPRRQLSTNSDKIDSVIPKIIVLLFDSALLISAAPAQQPAPAKPRAATCGPLARQFFNCPKFGFTYQIPVSWVDRTAEMQVPDSPTEQKKTASSQTLLAIFERPPQASGQTINSSVIIAAESRSDYPQVKTAADYFGPINDLAEQSGLKPAGDPYAFPLTSKQLVREDFTGERGKLPIYQSSLVTITKGQIVSFTFIGGTEDDVEDLIANLQFQPAAREAPRR